MMENHHYNLYAQIVQESKSLKRIKNNYIADAGACPDCTPFWEKMLKDKEEHIDELNGLIAKHLNA